ncbi:MAG: hypothetical protein QM758_07910 [Armatimonas sp.]
MLVKTNRRLRALGACLAFAACSVAHAQNLITNGDFSAGNTGFTSQYTYKPPPATGQGQYFVGADPHGWYGPFPSFFDHTTGTAAGSMMMVDAGTITPSLVVWSQNILVTPNTGYNFSLWLANIGATNVAKLDISINGTSIGGVVNSTGSSNWQSFTRNWNSGASTSALIELRDTQINANGNDFALDDIRLVAVPEPGTLALMIVPAVALPLWRRRRKAPA